MALGSTHVTSGLQVLNVSGQGRKRGAAIGLASAARVRDFAPALLADAVQATGHSVEEAVSRLVEDCGFAHAMRLHTPWLVEEAAGLAATAGVPFENVMAMNLGDELWALAPDAQPDHCSSVGIAGPPTVIAQNMDLPAAFLGQQQIVRSEELLLLSFPGGLGLNGANAQGVAVCCMTLRQLPTAEDGLPVVAVLRLLLEQRSMSEAVDALRGVRHASGQAYLVGDRTGVRLFECSVDDVVEVPVAGASACHTNHPLAHPAAEPDRGDGPLAELAAGNSRVRLRSLRSQLGSARDGAAAWSALSARDDPAHPVLRGEHLGAFTFATTLATIDAEGVAWQVRIEPSPEAEVAAFRFPG